MDNQVNETREQLRARLKNKINSKRINRTHGISRKKSEDMNESFKKISEILINKNIQSTDQIDTSLIETIMGIISKQDIELMLSKMQNNSQFKNMLTTIGEKMQSVNKTETNKETDTDKETKT